MIWFNYSGYRKTKDLEYRDFTVFSSFLFQAAFSHSCSAAVAQHSVHSHSQAKARYSDPSNSGGGSRGLLRACKQFAGKEEEVTFRQPRGKFRIEAGIGSIIVWLLLFT